MSVSFKNVRLARLQLAIAAAGFSPTTNQLDKIIAENAEFHADGLPGVVMAMSSAVVDRINQLAGVDAESVSTETTKPKLDPTPPVVKPKTPIVESTTPIVEPITPTVETITPTVETTTPIVEPLTPEIETPTAVEPTAEVDEPTVEDEPVA